MTENRALAPPRPPDVRPHNARRVAALLALLFAASACSSRAPAAPAAPAVTTPKGSVSGVVLSAPACPGPERIGRPCPPRPVRDAVVQAVFAAKTVASARTDADGTFQLSLPEGQYVIRATNAGGYPSTAETTVRASVARPVSITLTVDSGIR